MNYSTTTPAGRAALSSLSQAVAICQSEGGGDPAVAAGYFNFNEADWEAMAFDQRVEACLDFICHHDPARDAEIASYEAANTVLIVRRDLRQLVAA